MQTYPVINWNNATAKTGEQLEFFPLTCTPHNENCTPAGQNREDQIKECTALINQLIRKAGQPDPGAEFFIIENTGHDFGTYFEAGIFYIPTPEQEEDEEGQEDKEEEESQSEIYAMVIEQNIPDTWDEEALQELRASGHTMYQPAKVIKMKAA